MLGIYCRISREKEEGKDRSIKEQELSGIQQAKELKVSYRIYKDEGFSGTLPIDKRPELSRLIDDIYSGVVTKVYVYDQSRLERSLESRFALNKVFKEENIEVYTDSGLVGRDIESEFTGDIISVINNFYTKITAKKIKSVLARNSKEGKAHGILPYGYFKDDEGYMQIDAEEEDIVKRIFAMSLEGIGTNRIAEQFNKEGIETRYNKISKGTLTYYDKYDGRETKKLKSDIRWAGNTILNIIKNETYTGKRLFGGVEYECKPILEFDYWKQINDNLSKNSNNTGKNVSHKYLLKGLLRCGKCGRNYYGRRRANKKDNYYTCSSKRHKHLNCGNKSINIDTLENFIWLKFIGDNELRKHVIKHIEHNKESNKLDVIDSELKTLSKELSKKTKGKDTLLDLAQEGVLSKEDIKSKIKKINKGINDVSTKIKNLNNQKDLLQTQNFDEIVDGINLVHLDSPFNDKKEILKKYIQEIVVHHIPSDYEGRFILIKENMPSREQMKFNYFVAIKTTIQGMEEIVYLLNTYSKTAHTIVDTENEESIDLEVIKLGSKKEFPVNMMTNSRTIYETFYKV